MHSNNLKIFGNEEKLTFYSDKNLVHLGEFIAHHLGKKRLHFVRIKAAGRHSERGAYNWCTNIRK